MTDVQFRFRKGAGSNLDVLFGTVTLKPTLAHSRGTSMVLPAPSTWDIINGEVLATNVQPTPEPVGGVLEWGYEVTVKDRHGKSYSFLVGVPDSTSAVEFVSLPRYFETKPPLFGQGPKGDAGEAATVTVGTVTKGTEANVSNSGTSSNAILDFVLPKGDKGDKGDGVPSGGTAFQYIRKDSTGSGTEWATLDKTSVGLGDVDNTSDLNKPVSSAQQEALDEIVNSEDVRISEHIGNTASKIREELTKNFVPRAELVVSVKDFGALGDGITDDTEAIQTALSSGASTVFVPDGEYLISSSLRVYSNTLFYTNSAKIRATGDFSDQQFINSFGTYLSSNDRELSVAVNAGARILTTKTAHPYQPGDTLRLVSQRVSTNPDDAGDEQLGWATINSNGAYFAEFVRVQEVPSPTTLKLDVGLLFNGYRPDKAQETDPFALSSAILRKTNSSGDNITIKGFELIGEAPHGIRCIRGINVRVENIKWVRQQAGKFIQFIDCAYTRAYKCEIETLQWFESDNGVDHAAINQYHVAGCWQTGFIECSSVRGTQPFDFTYSSTAPYTSVWCYVRNSVTISCLHNPVTSHPGTYGIKVLDNDFQSCQRAGISVRSNRSEVRGNSVVGSGYADAPGIYLLEGGGKKSLITNNIVESFDTGLRINDGANKPFKEKIHTVFRGNTIRDFSTGFKITRMSGMPIPSAQQGIELVDNRFETSKTGAVGVVTCENGRGVRGLVLKGNTFDFGAITSSANTGIAVTANTKDLLVEDNIFIAVGTLVNYDNTGFLPGYSYDNILWVNSVRSFTSYETLPPDTANLQITYTGPRALVYIEADMNTMLSEKRFRMSSTAAVSLGKGFPVDNASGWGEVVTLSSSTVTQKFYEESTTSPTIWTRRINANSQTPWKKVPLV